MPYLHEKNGISLRSIGKDRRIKLSTEDKATILKRWQGGEAMRALAREYKVDRYSIRRICRPEIVERHREMLKARGGSKIYYDKDKHREYIKKTRKHRQKIFGKETEDGSRNKDEK